MHHFHSSFRRKTSSGFGPRATLDAPELDFQFLHLAAFLGEPVGETKAIQVG